MYCFHSTLTRLFLLMLIRFVRCFCWFYQLICDVLVNLYYVFKVEIVIWYKFRVICLFRKSLFWETTTTAAFYGHYTGQLVLAGTSRILFVQSFTACMPLLTASSAFILEIRYWSAPQQCYLHCLHMLFIFLFFLFWESIMSLNTSVIISLLLSSLPGLPQFWSTDSGWRKDGAGG